MERSWKVDPAGRTPGLLVVTPKRTHVFPWAHLMTAEGDAGAVSIAFTTHDVKIEGSGLLTLLKDIALQRVTSMQQMKRTERFQAPTAPAVPDPDRGDMEDGLINKITVQEAGPAKLSPALAH